MADYVDPDLVSDETALSEQFLSSLTDQIAEWEPHDGQIEPPIAEATAVIAAAVNQLLKDSARADYASWGLTVLGVPIIPATLAVSTVQVEFTAAGTLEAGAQLVATLPDGDDGVFVTLTDAVGVAPGSIVTGVPVAATATGDEYNDATGVMAPGTPYAFILDVTLEAPTGGGGDEEDANAYLARLADRAQRQVGHAVTVADFAAFATDIAGVARCLAVNLLDPAHPLDVSEGHITLVPIDADGDDCNPTICAEVVAYFGEDERPVQVTVHTDGATRTAVTVTFEATAVAGADGAAAVAAAEAAVTAYLSPALWGFDNTLGGKWRSSNTVDYLEVAQVIQEVQGIDRIPVLLINGDRENVTLPGVAALPLPSVSGTFVP